MGPIQSDRRIEYAGSVHDEREIEAVVEVLRGGPTALRIGKNVKAMEQRVAELFGKRRGVMCNSGSLGALPRGRGARPRARRRDHHVAGHVLDRRRADGPRRARPGLRRRHARHVPDRRRRASRR